jgi:nitroreductase
MLRQASEFLTLMQGRRSVRMFSTEPVPRKVIEAAVEAAGTAPSGAHKQPWTFVIVTDSETKQQLRTEAEEAERRFYGELAPEEWLRDLEPLGTDWEKTHLTDAPYVIVVFAQDYGLDADGNKRRHYYVNESVGIAVGILLVALRTAGLVALTHTPAPMDFVRRVLSRPKNERPYLLIPVGYPAADGRVPDIRRKSLDEFVVWYEPPPG